MKMEKEKKIWGNPVVDVQQFVPQEFVASCKDYTIGFSCEYTNSSYPSGNDATVGEYINQGSHGGGNILGYSGNGNCNTYITPEGRRWERGGASVPEDGFSVSTAGTYTLMTPEDIGTLLKSDPTKTYNARWATYGADNLWYVHTGIVGFTKAPNLS